MLNIKKIKPTFNRVVTSYNCYEEDVSVNGIIVKNKGAMKEYQTVVATGDTVKNVKVGDMVIINPMRYAKPLQKSDSVLNNVESYSVKMVYNIPRINIDGEECLILFDSDIDFVVEEFEEESDLIQTPKHLIEV